jgi:hypothetical protein
MTRKSFALIGALVLACGDDEPAARVPPGGSLLDGSVDAAPPDGGAGGASDASAFDSALPDAAPFDGPTSLSQTGLYLDIISKSFAAGVMPYDVRYPLWSDGATKTRYLQLPAGAQIDTQSMDLWVFPVGTKAWKEFRKDGKLIETRYLEKRKSGATGWLKVAYVWNDEATEAYAAPLGVKNAKGTSHDVPNQDDCSQCHDGESDVLIGVGAIQLSKEAGGGSLSTLKAQGLLSHPPAAEFPVPGDGVVEEALGYLHANCGHCHNNTHFLATKRNLRLKLLTTDTTPESTPTYLTTINAAMNHVLDGTTLAVVPGDPSKSQLYLRMNERDLDSMPPVGTEEVDSIAMTTIFSWIAGL